MQILRTYMKVALWNSYCPSSEPVTEISDASFAISNACNLAGAGPTPAPAAFLRRMFESIDRSEVQVASAAQCMRDPNNIMVARRPDGSALILACPRSLLRSGNAGAMALRADLARALGHSVDSCALEMMSAGSGSDARSLSRLSDGLRACLVDNHLRTPALIAGRSSARRNDPASGPMYTPPWLGEELGDGRAVALGLDIQGSAPRRTHCSSVLDSSGASTGGSMESRRQNPANALEAQYWATQALTLSLFEVNSDALTSQPIDSAEWSSFCDSLGYYEREGCIRAAGATAANRRLFRLRAMLQPACRGIATSDSTTARALFGVINRDPSIRSFLGCAVNTTAEVNSLQLPSLPQAQGSTAHPNAGHCGTGLLETELAALTNGRGARDTLRVDGTAVVGSGAAGQQRP